MIDRIITKKCTLDDALVSKRWMKHVTRRTYRSVTPIILVLCAEPFKMVLLNLPIGLTYVIADARRPLEDLEMDLQLMRLKGLKRALWMSCDYLACLEIWRNFDKRKVIYNPYLTKETLQ